MKLNYNLDEDDYLNFQLYYVSHNKEAIKRQNKARYSLLATCLAFSVVSFISHNMITAYYFLLSTVICFFFYPRYAAWLYKRALRKQVNLIYKDHSTIFTNLVFEETQSHMRAMEGLLFLRSIRSKK